MHNQPMDAPWLRESSISSSQFNLRETDIVRDTEGETVRGMGNKGEKSKTINSVMDREQAKAITEYDHLFSIQIGLLLPWIVRLFSVGARRGLQNVESRKKDESFLSVE